MKNRELVEILLKLDPEADLYAEGCDCTNPVKDVSVMDEYRLKPANAILIEVDLD